jgi:hypothetical protein
MRLTASGPGAERPIAARCHIAAPPEAVALFPSDLTNHAILAPRSVELTALDSTGAGCSRALVRLRGPFGIRRTAATELLAPTRPGSIAGTARIGRRTEASVVWTILESTGGSEVTLSATVDAAGPLDALWLWAWGRRWLAGHFAAALDRLAVELAAETEFDPARALGHSPAGRPTPSTVPAPAGRAAS